MFIGCCKELELWRLGDSGFCIPLIWYGLLGLRLSRRRRRWLVQTLRFCTCICAFQCRWYLFRDIASNRM